MLIEMLRRNSILNRLTKTKLIESSIGLKEILQKVLTVWLLIESFNQYCK